MLTKIEDKKINANELKIIQAINGKKFNEISMHMQKILLTMFGNIDSNDELSAEIVMGFKKPDIQVKYKNVTKYISIKGGNNENVHKEEVKTFVLFLRNLGVSIKTQQTILYYHYSDRTMDGSGKIRYTFSEMMKILGKRIKEANEELNNSKFIIENSVTRALFDGVIQPIVKADYIYHGDEKAGILCSQEEILNYINKNAYYAETRLHIGPLVFFPHGRYPGLKPLNEIQKKRREKVGLKWLNFRHDLITAAKKKSPVKGN